MVCCALMETIQNVSPLPLLKRTSPILLKRSVPVESITPEIERVVAGMFATMRKYKGCGLAAPQVGVSLRIAVIDIHPDEPTSTIKMNGAEFALEDFSPIALINPEVRHSGKWLFKTEGCLTFPGLACGLWRPDKIEVKATQLDGSVIEFECTGLISRAIQHEVDHLNGILFTKKTKDRSPSA